MTELIVAVPALLTSTFEAVFRVSVLLAIVTVPSSKESPPAVWADPSVTVYALTASVPAAKTAVDPATHAPVAVDPVESAVQKVLVPHVPVGVAPAPAVAP